LKEQHGDPNAIGRPLELMTTRFWRVIYHLLTIAQHALPMPNQSAALANPVIRLLPESPPQEASDPLPVLRREISLLRIELERWRAMENEARKTNELLVAYIDRIMENRNEWQREAERLGALCPKYQKTLDKARWPLFWWRNTNRAKCRPDDSI
jgi:hypothetical protein